jgi:hypothetical protein
MARWDQFVGLNKLANEFIENLDNNIEPEPFVLCSQDETLTGISLEGFKFHVPMNDGANKQFTFKEEIQRVVWSGGPMYFTHLRMYMYKHSGQVLDMGTYYSWVMSPEGFLNSNFFEKEYDYDQGIIYI